VTAVRERWRDLRAQLAPPYWRELERAVAPSSSTLDVGCGASSPLARFHERLGRLVGVEAHPDAAAAARASGVYAEVLELDVRTLRDEFEPRSFEVVAAVDLLEHLEEPDGRDLLDAAQVIAARRVVIFTPNGFVPQGARGGNEWQVHRSGWSAAALAARGYRVTGVHGLRWLRGEEADIRMRPRRAWSLVADLTQPVARRVPAVAYHLLAVKDVATR
jgi:predicted TPR repeat methyltransferase